LSDERFYERACAWAYRRRARIAGHNPFVVTINVVRNSVEDRVAGLAAEMAFWAMLSFFPLLVTIAALLGYSERLIGPEQLERGQAAVVSAVSVVFTGELVREVVDPFIGGLLRAERGGIALTGLVAALYLASRVFAATIRALDLAYRVPERRGLVMQRLIAFGLAGVFVVVAVLTVLIMVVGPLLGTGQLVAEQIRLGRAFQAAWGVLRWPFLVAVLVTFLAMVYRQAPNVANRLRDCLPGAALGVAAWLLASLALRVFLAAGGGGAPAIDTEDQAVALVGRVVGTIVALMLWVFVTGLALLVGGELNAELARSQAPSGDGEMRPVPASGTMPDEG
jgi:membrane protein